jgi:competence protein ComEC
LLASRKLKHKALIFLGAAIVTLALTLTLNRLAAKSAFTAAALNVGQGQSLVFTAPNAAVVIDCGGSVPGNEGDIAADYLISQGVITADALVLTHFHADHANGAARLLSRIRFKRLIVPKLTEEEYGSLAESIFSTAERSGAELVYIDTTQEFNFDGIDLTLFPPLGAASENERGVTILLSGGDFSALIMGDASTETELRLMEYTDLPDVDVLFVGHHGSKTSTSDRFLTDITPELAVISVSADNSYGHPASETLERLEQRGIAVCRTDKIGRVTLRSNAER